MKSNFFTSMFSESGKISHKRVISVCAAALILFMGAYATLNYKEFVLHIFDWVIVFILVMSGVATIPQILALLRGTPLPKDEDQVKAAKELINEKVVDAKGTINAAKSTTLDDGSKPGEEGRPDNP